VLIPLSIIVDDDDVCGARHSKSEDMHIQTESCL